MKIKLIIFCLTLFAIQALPLSSYAQGAPSVPNRMTAPLSMPEAEGSSDLHDLFLNQSWSPGIVEFKSKRPLMERPIIFDVDNDKLYYLENGLTMEFTDSISQFSMKLLRDGDSTYVVFRTSYPNLGANTRQTFYEVMVDGNFQLVKCRAKTIRLFKEPDILDKKNPVHKELLFAFTPDKKLVLVKKDIEYLTSQMPEFADEIKQAVDEHKIKLKNEKRVKELFTYLNKPKP